MVGPKAFIHIENLFYNYNLIKHQLNGTPIMAVVKANAYGHGAVPVTKALRSKGVNHFAVFTFEEALELRAAGIEEDILVFCRPTKDMLAEAAARNIALNLSALEDLSLFIEEKPSPKFHLKVDTGMSRLGIPYNSMVDTLQQIKSNEHLQCEGIYSHYATADEGELSYAEYQLEQFNQVLQAAEELDLKIKHIHFSNSGTVLNMPQTSFNLVRVGMLLYGAFPSDEVPMDMPIKPVMEFKGPVVALREVSAGTKVSYGGVWEAPQDTIIGVIQTGFADGFPRSWYMDGYVGLRGKHYPIAGRVCMDQFMVDFGEANVSVGDEVLIFGQNDAETIRIEDIAQAIDSTSYVLLTAIGGRTERIFIN